MASRRLGQLHVRLQTDSFKISDAVCCQCVVEVLGNRVGVATHASSVDWWRRESEFTGRAANSMNQSACSLAGLQLLTNRLGVLFGQYFV